MSNFHQGSLDATSGGTLKIVTRCHQLPYFIFFAFLHLTRQNALCHYHALPCNSPKLFSTVWIPKSDTLLTETRNINHQTIAFIATNIIHRCIYWMESVWEISVTQLTNKISQQRWALKRTEHVTSLVNIYINMFFLWGGGLVSILNFWDISISQSSFSSLGRFGMKRSHTLSGLTCTNCWWKKSCTSQYPEDPSFHRVVYIPKWCRISSINSISHNMHIVFHVDTSAMFRLFHSLFCVTCGQWMAMHSLISASEESDHNPQSFGVCTRWPPTSYKWSYKPYKWPYNWVTEVKTSTTGVLTLVIIGRGPSCMVLWNDWTY